MPTYVDAIETFLICTSLVGALIYFFPNPTE